jgi:hypothetical protein
VSVILFRTIKPVLTGSWHVRREPPSSSELQVSGIADLQETPLCDSLLIVLSRQLGPQTNFNLGRFRTRSVLTRTDNFSSRFRDSLLRDLALAGFKIAD